MDLQQDFKELLACFNRGGVEYLIVGGHTGDLDLYVNTSRGNAGRIMSALRTFGFGGIDLNEEDFCTPGKAVQLGVPPVRVDIVTSIDGVKWNEAWNARTEGTCGGERVCVICRQELVRNKRALGRKKDLADLEALGEP